MSRVTIDRFQREPATHIVSLGPRCATTYNLRRHYDFASAYPFDWWITPRDGLVTVLQSLDADWIYRADHLALTEDKASVVHRPTGILLHHEFPRDRSQPTAPVIENFRDVMDGPRRRTAYLFDKFRSLDAAGTRIVFVRETEPDQGLEDALSSLFTRCKWTVASIPSIPEDEHGWVCSPTKWDDLLASLNITFDRAGHRPFVPVNAEHADDPSRPDDRRVSGTQDIHADRAMPRSLGTLATVKRLIARWLG